MDASITDTSYGHLYYKLLYYGLLYYGRLYHGLTCLTDSKIIVQYTYIYISVVSLSSRMCS